MLGKLNKGTMNFIVGARDFFTLQKSKVYVEDFRKKVTHNVIESNNNIEGRQCRYPKNYHDIVKNGIIQIAKSSDKQPIYDKNNPVYELVFGEKDKEGKQPSFRLTSVKDINGNSYQDDNKSYFTIEYLVGKHPSPNEKQDYSEFYKPFGFSKTDLEKYLPVFEIEKINAKEKNEPAIYKLTNSSVLIKQVKKDRKVQEVIDEEGRDGKFLYASYSKPLSIHFFEIRDERGNLELAKSLFISVPIVFVTTLPEILVKLFTTPLIKIGEYLIGKQNPIAKAIGKCLFTPTAAVKNLINIGAALLRAPILLFTANKDKYDDAYYKMWKEQIKVRWGEINNDYNLIKKGSKPELQEEDERSDHQMIGTWDELNMRKSEIPGKISQETKDRSNSTETFVSSNHAKKEEYKRRSASNESLRSRS